MPKIVNTSGINGGQTDFTSVYPVAIVNDDGYTILGSNDFVPVGVASGSASIPVSQSGSFYVEQSGTWTVQQGNAPWTVDAIQSGTWAVQASQPSGEHYTVALADASYDAFGRIRMSEVQSLFDSKQSVHNDSEIWDALTVSGSQTFSPATASTTLNVSGVGAYSIRQTFQRMNYTPAKSQLIFLTATNMNPVANVVKRVGYYNSNFTAPYNSELDGIWFEASGTSMYCKVGNLGVEESASQANWNIDKLDGNGPSGKTVTDWSLNQIYFMDFEWLGVGTVRFGVAIDEQLVYVHAFRHANVTTGVYMSSPNHSVRYEVRSNGPSASLVHICSSVGSEAGSEPRTVQRAIDNGTGGVTGPSAGTVWAPLGIRLDPTVTNAGGINVVLESTEMMTSTANANGGWSLLLNPTIAGTPTWQTIPNFSGVQFFIGSNANTITGGTKIVGGLYSSSTRATTQTSDSLTRIGIGISGVSQTLILSNFNTINNASIFANIDLKLID